MPPTLSLIHSSLRDILFTESCETIFSELFVVDLEGLISAAIFVSLQRISKIDSSTQLVISAMYLFIKQTNIKVNYHVQKSFDNQRPKIFIHKLHSFIGSLLSPY